MNVSAYAKEAFELTRMQEETKQKELMGQAKDMEVRVLCCIVIASDSEELYNYSWSVPFFPHLSGF